MFNKNDMSHLEPECERSQIIRLLREEFAQQAKFGSFDKLRIIQQALSFSEEEAGLFLEWTEC